QGWGDFGAGGLFQDWSGVFLGLRCPELLEGSVPSLPQYLQMKWPLLDVPAGATLKDSRSPSPAHLVRAAPRRGVPASQHPPILRPGALGAVGAGKILRSKGHHPAVGRDGLAGAVGRPGRAAPGAVRGAEPCPTLSPQSNKVPVVQHAHHMHPLTPLITYSSEPFPPGSPPGHLSPDIDPKTGERGRGSGVGAASASRPTLGTGWACSQGQGGPRPATARAGAWGSPQAGCFSSAQPGGDLGGSEGAGLLRGKVLEGTGGSEVPWPCCDPAPGSSPPTGIPRPPHPPELPPYYPLCRTPWAGSCHSKDGLTLPWGPWGPSPSSSSSSSSCSIHFSCRLSRMLQAPGGVGREGLPAAGKFGSLAVGKQLKGSPRPVYSIPAGGFRHPYPALAMNASMSRWVLGQGGTLRAPRSWHWLAQAQSGPRRWGWSPQLKTPPEGVAPSLGLDQCHHLRAGVGSGGFQVDSGAEWIWGYRVDWGSSMLSGCALGVLRVSSSPGTGGSQGGPWLPADPPCSRVPPLQFDVQPLLPAHGPAARARAAPLGHPAPHHRLAHPQLQPRRQLVSGGRAVGPGAAPGWGPEPCPAPCRKSPAAVKKEEEKKPHIKKPLNAFMLYMKEMRAKVVAECTLKESAAINQILGRRVRPDAPQGPLRAPGFPSPLGSDPRLGLCQPGEPQGAAGDWDGRDGALLPRAGGARGQQCGFGDSSRLWGFQSVALSVDLRVPSLALECGSGVPSLALGVSQSGSGVPSLALGVPSLALGL
ncbi:hypothetical protein DV515_00019338, partial [Chloebia gouldiae]